MNFTSPLRIKAGSKMMTLSLNDYSAANHWRRSAAKKAYHKLMAIKIREVGVVKLGKINIKYTLFFPDKKARDIGNFGAVIDKFFSDTLVECGVIEDDDFKHVQGIKFEFGGIDKQNPRAEIEIIEIF